MKKRKRGSKAYRRTKVAQNDTGKIKNLGSTGLIRHKVFDDQFRGHVFRKKKQHIVEK